MRIALVTGLVTLSSRYYSLVGGRFVICSVLSSHGLVNRRIDSFETVVSYDHLGASVGDVVAFTESREATMPFYPERIVPLDAYVVAIIDSIDVSLEVIRQIERDQQ
jgi:microcompartment protein CcmK/EutM